MKDAQTLWFKEEFVKGTKRIRLQKLKRRLSVLLRGVQVKQLTVVRVSINMGGITIAVLKDVQIKSSMEEFV